MPFFSSCEQLTYTHPPSESIITSTLKGMNKSQDRTRHLILIVCAVFNHFSRYYLY